MLDVGCGNGWFMHKTASHVDRLTGLDINKLELEQAASVLAEHNNVDLKYGDIFKIEAEPVYDLVLFNASVQYFVDLSALLQRVSEFLTPVGEVHILDSPFYTSSEAASQAKSRTQDYYQKNGVAEMADFYHHHTFQDLAGFQFKILYNPNALAQKLKRRLISDIPLYWVVVKFD